MQVSLIITTYNWKEALALVLKSALAQRVPPCEIIIGDDGSRPDTAEIIKTAVSESFVPVKHIWQEDLGFRAAKIRNRAIAATNGDYVVMIDGDIVLHPNFIKDHAATARRGFFVQGGRLKSGPHQTENLLQDHDSRLNIFSADLRNRKNLINSKLLSRVSSYRTQSLEGIRTCNFAAWRDDILAVNGFDEEFIGWGREDSDFALRLMNAGVKRFNLKFLANATHLHHQENSRDNFAKNDARLEQRMKDGTIRCAEGVDQYL